MSDIDSPDDAARDGMDALRGCEWNVHNKRLVTSCGVEKRYTSDDEMEPYCPRCKGRIMIDETEDIEDDDFDWGSHD